MSLRYIFRIPLQPGQGQDDRQGVGITLSHFVQAMMTLSWDHKTKRSTGSDQLADHGSRSTPDRGCGMESRGGLGVGQGQGIAV